MATRGLTAEPLQVVPELIGKELASPRRRMIAFAIDFMLLWPPTVVVAILWVLATMWLFERPALNALRIVVQRTQLAPEVRHAALRDLAPLMVRLEADGLPHEVEDAVHAGNLDGAAEVLAGKELMIALSIDPHSDEQLARSLAAKNTVRVPLERLIPGKLRGVAAYGVGAIYFTLLARGRRGATLGKRLVGIRIVRLDGHRLTLWEGLERFVGYLHIPGSLGIGLFDLWHDPNRRMAHDRVVHTAVIRIRKETPLAPPDDEPPEEEQTDPGESESESSTQGAA
jgi:uncharacterized RDD family membrane protein YckC